MDEDAWLEHVRLDQTGGRRRVVTEPGRHRAPGSSVAGVVLRWIGGGAAGLILVAAAALDSRPAPGHPLFAEPSTSTTTADQAEAAREHMTWTGAPANVRTTQPSDPQPPVEQAPPAVPPAEPTAATPGTPAAASTVEPSWADIVIEAEATGVTLSGTAAIAAEASASGGQLVTGLGTASDGRSGMLQITGPDLAAGTYRITLYLVGTGTRTVIVTVNGVEKTISATGPSAIAIDVNVPAGPLSILLANPTGPAPALDKLVVSRP